MQDVQDEGAVETITWAVMLAWALIRAQITYGA